MESIDSRSDFRRDNRWQSKEARKGALRALVRGDLHVLLLAQQSPPRFSRDSSLHMAHNSSKSITSIVANGGDIQILALHWKINTLAKMALMVEST